MLLFKSSMTDSAGKLSFVKWKKMLSSLAILSAFFISMSSGVLSAGAIDPADTITLSADMWRGICGANNTLSVHYLATDMTYKAATMTYNTTQVIRSVDCAELASSAYAGREIVFYTMHAPADFYLPAFSSGVPNVIVSLDLHFQNVTYFDFAYVNPIYNKQDWQSTYNSISASQLSEWAFIQAGDSISDIHSIPARANSGSPAICINNNHPSELQGFCPSIDVGNFSDYYVGDVSFAPALTENRGDLYLGLVCPVLNSGYIYVGHDTPPPAPVTTSPAGSGSMQGEIVSGSDGYTVVITNDLPGFMYTGTYSDMSDNLGEAVTSIAEEAGAAAESAASAVGGLAAYDSGILWYMLERLFHNHPEVIAIISGLGAISLFGFVLNRYGR